MQNNQTPKLSVNKSEKKQKTGSKDKLLTNIFDSLDKRSKVKSLITAEAGHCFNKTDKFPLCFDFHRGKITSILVHGPAIYTSSLDYSVFMLE